MDAIERQVTLPVDLEEAWDLLTRPDDLAGWLGAEVDARPHPGRRGRGRRPRRHRARGWSSTRSSRAGGWPGAGGTTTAPSEAQPGGDHPRARRRTAPRVRVVEELVGAAPGRPQAPAPARPGRTGCSTSRRCSWSPPPSGGDAGPPDADARAGAVFEALADPTRRAVLRDVAEPRPAHRHRAGRRAAGQPPGRRQAPGRAAGGRPGRAPRARAARPGFTAHPGPRSPRPGGGCEPPGRLGRPPGPPRRARRGGRAARSEETDPDGRLRRCSWCSRWCSSWFPSSRST